MKRFVTRRFNVAVHDSGGGRDSDLMGGLDQLNPLRGADPARRNLVAYLIDQNLGGSSRQTADPRRFKCGQIIADRDAAQRGAIQNLLGREAVDMEAWNGLF